MKKTVEFTFVNSAANIEIENKEKQIKIVIFLRYYYDNIFNILSNSSDLALFFNNS